MVDSKRVGRIQQHDDSRNKSDGGEISFSDYFKKEMGKFGISELVYLIVGIITGMELQTLILLYALGYI